MEYVLGLHPAMRRLALKAWVRYPADTGSQVQLAALRNLQLEPKHRHRIEDMLPHLFRAPTPEDANKAKLKRRLAIAGASPMGPNDG